MPELTLPARTRVLEDGLTLADYNIRGSPRGYPGVDEKPQDYCDHIFETVKWLYPDGLIKSRFVLHIQKPVRACSRVVWSGNLCRFQLPTLISGQVLSGSKHIRLCSQVHPAFSGAKRCRCAIRRREKQSTVVSSARVTRGVATPPGGDSYFSFVIILPPLPTSEEDEEEIDMPEPEDRPTPAVSSAPSIYEQQ